MTSLSSSPRKCTTDVKEDSTESVLQRPQAPQGLPGGSVSKESACEAGDLIRPLGREDPLEEKVATHSGILAWRRPWTEGGLRPMGSQRVGHD